jgi:hypothetical protein
MTNPDQIRRDIERTQDNLREDVNALGQKVSPSHIAERRVHAARGALGNVKEKIMGTASSGGSTVKDKVGSAASSVGDQASSLAGGVGSAASSAGDAISSAGDAITGAPQAARQHTAGNPLAAGLIAFGAGWLLSSMLPASEREQEMASTVQEKAGEHLQPALQQAGQEVAGNLREPAQQAVESVKSTASDAASTVRDEAGSAAGDVSDQAQQAKQAVSDRS